MAIRVLTNRIHIVPLQIITDLGIFSCFIFLYIKTLGDNRLVNKMFFGK